MPELELWKIFTSLGIPGLALGIYYMLFKQFRWDFPRVPNQWVGPIIILFMLIAGSLTFHAMSLWAPRNSTTESQVNNTDKQGLQILKVVRFLEDSEGNFNLDVSVNNSANSPVNINGFWITFIGIINPEIEAQSVREVSSKYVVRDHSGKPVMNISGEKGTYKAYAWYPSISSDRAMVKADLFQVVPSNTSDRFHIIFDMRSLPAPNHHTAIINLQYKISGDEVEKSVNYILSL
ncbi:MAG: hypothetical protein Q8L97_03990 [Nitrosomonas sp.]|nr:hypothetical protein [Nitrosomonas sp.]